MPLGYGLGIPCSMPYTATSPWVNVDKGILQAQLESVPIGFLLDYLKPIQLMGFYLKYPKPIRLSNFYLKYPEPTHQTGFELDYPKPTLGLIVRRFCSSMTHTFD